LLIVDADSQRRSRLERGLAACGWRALAYPDPAAAEAAARMRLRPTAAQAQEVAALRAALESGRAR